MSLSFAGEKLHALPEGALWWPAQEVLVVSDLHLGKSERIARRSGQLLPPYETIETLAKLKAVLHAYRPRVVVSLGDSFDDLPAANDLEDPVREQLLHLQDERRWIWIEGNHDAGPPPFAGEVHGIWTHGPLTFRHIADPAATAEISGHFHPKATLHARGRAITRPAFLVDGQRIVMPAFGVYTGGLRSSDVTLSALMASDATAVLTGATPCQIPMPR